MKKWFASSNGQCPGLLGFVIFLLLLMPEISLAQPDVVAKKLALISLVEDKLAGAYLIKRLGDLPDFALLDEIYPSWDQGDPGKARREWVDKKLVNYQVVYRVDSVNLTSRYTARMIGKKTIRFTQVVPFLHWWTRDEQDFSRTRFMLEVYMSAQGQWRVKSETEY